MTRRIPPLNPLHTFEVVARTGNLTVAAAQLHVTQSAVSRQIGVLERYFGVQLFQRERVGVLLTEAGRRYAEQVIPAFAAIAAATAGVRQDQSGRHVRVGTYTTFAAKWLIPRLKLFQQQHPGVEVHIQRLVPEVNFDRDPVDVAIQVLPLDNGRPHCVSARADLLFIDCIEPVCSPAFLARHAPQGCSPLPLLHQRLLISKYHTAEWDEWLQSTGLAAEAAPTSRMVFNASMLTWHAAAEGLGIAIGHSHLLHEELGRGELVQPFRLPVLRERGYCLLQPLAQRNAASKRAFCDWLLAQAPKV